MGWVGGDKSRGGMKLGSKRLIIWDPNFYNFRSIFGSFWEALGHFGGLFGSLDHLGWGGGGAEGGPEWKKGRKRRSLGATSGARGTRLVAKRDPLL